MIKLLSLLLAVSLLPCCLSQLIATCTDYCNEVYQAEAVIPVEVQENEVTLTCTSTTEIEWWVDDILVEFNSSTGEGLGGYQYLSVYNENTMSSLNVTYNFSNPETRFEVQCMGDNETITFVLGKKRKILCIVLLYYNSTLSITLPHLVT